MSIEDTHVQTIGHCARCLCAARCVSAVGTTPVVCVLPAVLALCAGCVSGVCCCFCPCGLLCVWSASTCSLIKRSHTKSILVEDTHANYFFFMGAYIARPRCRLETRVCVCVCVARCARCLCAARCVSAVCRLCERCVLLFSPVWSAVCVDRRHGRANYWPLHPLSVCCPLCERCVPAV